MCDDSLSDIPHILWNFIEWNRNKDHLNLNDGSAIGKSLENEEAVISRTARLLKDIEHRFVKLR